MTPPKRVQMEGSGIWSISLQTFLYIQWPEISSSQLHQAASNDLQNCGVYLFTFFCPARRREKKETLITV